MKRIIELSTRELEWLIDVLDNDYIAIKKSLCGDWRDDFVLTETDVIELKEKFRMMLTIDDLKKEGVL